MSVYDTMDKGLQGLQGFGLLPPRLPVRLSARETYKRLSRDVRSGVSMGCGWTCPPEMVRALPLLVEMMRAGRPRGGIPPLAWGRD